MSGPLLPPIPYARSRVVYLATRTVYAGVALVRSPIALVRSPIIPSPSLKPPSVKPSVVALSLPWSTVADGVAGPVEYPAHPRAQRRDVVGQNFVYRGAEGRQAAL